MNKGIASHRICIPKNRQSILSENKNAPKRDMHPRQIRRRQSPKREKLFSENKNAPKRDMHPPFGAFLAPTPQNWFKRCA